MNRPQTAFVAILVGGGILWAMSSVAPPSKDMVQAAYRQGQVDGSLYWDKDYWVAWSVPGTFGHEWTCKVNLDIIADPDVITHGYYECSPWPLAGWLRGGPYSAPEGAGGAGSTEIAW